MPNRNLTTAELRELWAPLIADVRAKLDAASGGDEQLLWALRRKLSKELSYLERGKPMERKALKLAKRVEQHGLQRHLRPAFARARRARPERSDGRLHA